MRWLIILTMESKYAGAHLRVVTKERHAIGRLLQTSKKRCNRYENGLISGCIPQHKRDQFTSCVPSGAKAVPLTTFGRWDFINNIYLDIKGLTPARDDQFISALSGQGGWLLHKSNCRKINQIIRNDHYGFDVIIFNINNKAPRVFMTGGFIATLDVFDFIISSWSKVGNLIVQGK